MYKLLVIFTFLGTHLTLPTPESNASDGQESRKVLGSRVVTSVSVIMDGVNNTKTYFSDAVGKPVAKPATPTQLASPINLLNPDRYEFYTFDDSGDLVKRLMTLDEIQGIIASGDGEPTNYYSQSLNGDVPEQRVDEVINNVQNVLKEEIQAHIPNNKPEINGPDVSSTWNLILPAIFGTGQHLAPETVAVEETAKTEANLISTTTTLAAPSTAEPNRTSPTFKPIIDVQETTSVEPPTTDFKQNSFSTTLISTSQPLETTLNPVTTTGFKVWPTTSSQETTYAELAETTVSTMQPALEPKQTTVLADVSTVEPSSTLNTLSTSFKVVTVPMETTLYTEPTTLKPSEATSAPSTIIGTEQPLTTVKLDMTQTSNTLKPTESDSTIATVGKEPTPTIVNEDESTNTPTAQLETTTAIQDNSSNFQDFPVDELLNLLSSVGSSTTSKTTTLNYEATTENSAGTTNLAEEEITTPVTNVYEQQTIEMDKNINEAVDNVISQMINNDVSQTTIENLPTTYRTTEPDQPTTTLTDASDKNRYEEIDLENTDATSTMAYESKTIQPLLEQATTDYNLLLTTTDEVPVAQSTFEPNDVTTDAPVHLTPVKHLKTDSDLDYKFNTTQATITKPVSSAETQSTPEVYYITDFPLRVDTTTAEPTPTELQLNTTTEKYEATTIEVLSEASTQPYKEPTTPEFVTVETVTSSPKLEKQPEPQVVNRVSSTTVKEDTTWALVSTLAPSKPILSTESAANSVVDLVPKPLQGFGLEDSTSSLEADVFQFTELCNELAFSFWNSVTSGISFARSVVVSPFATTSVLAMVFLGARGATSGEMNDILKLDDMVTFNPHAVFKNVIESIEVSKKSGVAASVFVKELYSDKNKGKLLQFYKERVKQFYDGYVEEVNFKEINDIIRRRTNLLVKRQTWGKISEYLKDNSLFIRPPLAAVTANIFQTDCSDGSTAGRDGELHFVVLPSIRQRKLVPIPAVVYRSGFLAGYEPGLDATAVAIGSKDHTISTIFVIPGQQGISAPGDGLVRLETRLIESAFKQNSWSRLLRSLIPRPGLEVQIPRFSHKSVINATAALQRMGLKDVFNSQTADLKGLNGIAHELYLSDIIQTNTFSTCGEGRIDETHHSEIYPATTNRSFRRIRKIQNYHHDLSDEPRDYQRAFHDPLYDPTYLSLPLQFRPRQARLPDTPRLRFDRPFLYFVRHNPTGLILHMGRFNPRLLP